MKQLNIFINEKLRISSKNYIQYNYYPKDKFELREILEERLAEDKNADLNDIDVSQITDMGVGGFPNNKGLFEDLDPHNIDISLWNVSKVENMCGIFYGCANFNSYLNNWDVSNVEDMRYMFYGCKNFNCDLRKWNVSEVKYMRSMFDDCKKFTGEGLENWDISNVESIAFMFDGCPIENNPPSWYKV